MRASRSTRFGNWSASPSPAMSGSPQCLFALWAVLTRLAGIYSPRGWASTLAIVLFLGGIQLLMLGIIGEYLSRVYDEVRARPLYIVRARVGIEELKRGYR